MFIGTLDPDFLPESMFYPNGERLQGRRQGYSRKQIATRWGMPEPYFCMRCGRTDVYLEKAHLIDVSAGGMDDLRNIGLLCHKCHALQPITEKNDPKRAIYEALVYFQLFRSDGWHSLRDRGTVRHTYLKVQMIVAKWEMDDFLDEKRDVY